MSYVARPYENGVAVCASDGVRPIMFTVHHGLFTFKKKADDGWHEVTLSIEQLQALASVAQYEVLTPT